MWIGPILVIIPRVVPHRRPGTLDVHDGRSTLRRDSSYGATQPGNDEPIINIQGERAGLGPLDPSVGPAAAQWTNDFRTIQTLGMAQTPMTRHKEHQWLERVSGNSEQIVFVIYDLTDMAVVGSTSLFQIDQFHRWCKLGIAILDPGRRGPGLGTEAGRLVTGYAVHGLEMHSVHLRTHAHIHACRRAYENAGLREHGHRREARHHNGTWWDVISMDVLGSEWGNPVMRRLMAPDHLR
jgi:RimJ/RimL family protein N-acetyltransferase